MFTTTWYVQDREIEIASDYIGGRPAPWMPSNENYNVISVSVDGSAPQEFDAWGSIMDPEFDDEYSLRNIFQTICNDVLNAMWDDWDDVIYGVDGRRAIEIVDSCRAEARQFEELGIYDEDLLLEIVNDDEWH